MEKWLNDYYYFIIIIRASIFTLERTLVVSTKKNINDILVSIILQDKFFSIRKKSIKSCIVCFKDSVHSFLFPLNSQNAEFC